MSDKHPVANNHEELIAWQLCAQLRRLVLRYTRHPKVRQDRKFCGQIRSAARSAYYRTSEGFYRKRDGDCINFLVWARASLGEVSDQVGDGHEDGHFNDAQRDEMITFVKRACGANGGLRRYLGECKSKKPKVVPRPRQFQWTWRRYAPRPRQK